MKRISYKKDYHTLYKIKIGGENMKDYLRIKKIHAMEVLDSRGNPTVQVEVITEGGFSRSKYGAFWCFYGKL